MTPAELSGTVLHTVHAAVAAGELRVPLPERAAVSRPRPGGHGDYATNIALQLAGPAARPAREIAALLAPRLAASPGVATVDVTGPGFLNITLAHPDDPVHRALAEAGHYGHGRALAGRHYTVTPAPHLRAEVLADTVTRLLRAEGAQARMPRREGTSARPGGVASVEVASAEDPSAEDPSAEDPSATLRVDPARLTSAPPPGLPQDALRWALLRAAPHAAPRFPESLLEHRETNPLWRIRYAHSRTRALARNAADLGMRHTHRDGAAEQHPAARALGAVIGDLPTAVESAARHRAPDRLARHLERLADAFLRFQSDCPPLPGGDEPEAPAHHARLDLTAAAGIALANGLALLGITAPDRV